MGLSLAARRKVAERNARSWALRTSELKRLNAVVNHPLVTEQLIEATSIAKIEKRYVKRIGGRGK